MSLPPRAPAAAWKLEAKLSSSVAGARDLNLMAAYPRSMASGSTSAGTFSTTYTSSWGSLAGQLDLALQRLEVEDDEEELMKEHKRARDLVEIFCRGDSDTGVPERAKRWLSELGVGWVLDLIDDASAGTSLLPRAQSNLRKDWIRALTEIRGPTLRFVREQDVLEPFHLVVFKETVLNMLPFVDVLLAVANLDADTVDATNGNGASAEKLQILLDVRDALSRASINTKLCFQCWDSKSKVELETERRSDEVLSLLSAREQRLDETVWKTMEEVRTSILNDDDDDQWGIQSRQGSPDICKVTRSLITYIKSLDDDYKRVNKIVRRAVELGYYFPEGNKTDPLTSLTNEMVYSLQLKLAKRSESFPDESLRLIFLINNTHFICQQLYPLLRCESDMAMEAKVKDYIQKYLQVSWEPVLSCLYNHTPRWLRKNSALPKFDLEFQKTYTAQKHWKFPDPELRTRLRNAIIKKVVSGFTKYLEDNNITNPGITPLEREKMLLELFEG